MKIRLLGVTLLQPPGDWQLRKQYEAVVSIKDKSNKKRFFDLIPLFRHSLSCVGWNDANKMLPLYSWSEKVTMLGIHQQWSLVSRQNDKKVLGTKRPFLIDIMKSLKRSTNQRGCIHHTIQKWLQGNIDHNCSRDSKSRKRHEWKHNKHKMVNVKKWCFNLNRDFGSIDFFSIFSFKIEEFRL